MQLFVRELHLTEPDILVHPLLVCIVKWWQTHNHFKCQNAKCPPIDLVIMTQVPKHFWSQVLWGTCKVVSYLTHLKFLSKTKISQDHVSILLDKDILWFQITINYIL